MTVPARLDRIDLGTHRRVKGPREGQMHRSVFLSISQLCLVALAINCPFVPSADAQAARLVSPDAPDLGQGRTEPIGNQ
jgi:hypothetical protein